MRTRTTNFKKKPEFYPVVLDEKGLIKKRFDSMYYKTRIEKRALASKILTMSQIL